MEIGKKIVQIIGPTGVGKSKIAIKLAKEIKGEIISADSIQVYKDFDIGTDKISNNSMKGIPHFLIDIITDCSQFNASNFLNMSYKISEDIIKRGNVPIVCGGTALYLKTMINGIFPEKKEKKVSREHLNEIVNTKGLEYLWDELSNIDPCYAKKIGKNDRIRIVRAMEIYYNNGIPPSKIFKQTQTPYKNYSFIRVGLTIQRNELYKNIEHRVERMIENGFVNEVKYLRSKYPLNCPPFKSIGYKEILMFLNNEIDFETAKKLIKQHSKNFAKRQLSWFRQEKDINWFIPENFPDIEEFVKKSLWKDQ